MSMTKRLEALEAAVQAQEPEKMELIILFVNTDRSNAGAYRFGENGTLVPVSEGELANIHRDGQCSPGGNT